MECYWYARTNSISPHVTENMWYQKRTHTYMTKSHRHLPFIAYWRVHFVTTNKNPPWLWAPHRDLVSPASWECHSLDRSPQKYTHGRGALLGSLKKKGFILTLDKSLPNLPKQFFSLCLKVPAGVASEEWGPTRSPSCCLHRFLTVCSQLVWRLRNEDQHEALVAASTHFWRCVLSWCGA